MLWKMQKSFHVEVDDFVSELSPSLCSDTRLWLYKDMVERIPFLASRKVGSVVVEELVMRLRTVVFLKGEQIMRRGEEGDWMGFVGYGRVGIRDPSVSNVDLRHGKPAAIVRVLTQGEYVGEMGLLFSVKRTANVEALTWLRIHILSRRAFKTVKKKYPKEAAIIEHEVISIQRKMNYNYAKEDSNTLRALC
jgi:CRP-like cAMP-binding protein